MQGCGKSPSHRKSEAREESDSVAGGSGGDRLVPEHEDWPAVAARRAASRHSRQKHMQVVPSCCSGIGSKVIS
jgi:hypothetical protein